MGITQTLFLPVFPGAGTYSVVTRKSEKKKLELLLVDWLQCPSIHPVVCCSWFVPDGGGSFTATGII